MRRIGLAVVLAGRRDRPLGVGYRTTSFHAGIRCRRWLLGAVAAASCVLGGVQIGDSLGWTPGLTRLSSGPATTTVNGEWQQGMRGRPRILPCGQVRGNAMAYWVRSSCSRVLGLSLTLLSTLLLTTATLPLGTGTAVAGPGVGATTGVSVNGVSAGVGMATVGISAGSHPGVSNSASQTGFLGSESGPDAVPSFAERAARLAARAAVEAARRAAIAADAAQRIGERQAGGRPDLPFDLASR